jgi:hypothetical protein
MATRIFPKSNAKRHAHQAGDRNKTGEPLARELKKDLMIVPNGDPQEFVERLRKNNGSDTVLLIGHTDTLPGLIKALGHPADVKIEAQDYSNIFLVIPNKQGAPTLLSALLKPRSSAKNLPRPHAKGKAREAGEEPGGGAARSRQGKTAFMFRQAQHERL